MKSTNKKFVSVLSSQTTCNFLPHMIKLGRMLIFLSIIYKKFPKLECLLDYAGKACQGQTLYLIMIIHN